VGHIKGWQAVCSLPASGVAQSASHTAGRRHTATVTIRKAVQVTVTTCCQSQILEPKTDFPQYPQELVFSHLPILFLAILLCPGFCWPEEYKDTSDTPSTPALQEMNFWFLKSNYVILPILKIHYTKDFQPKNLYFKWNSTSYNLYVNQEVTF